MIGDLDPLGAARGGKIGVEGPPDEQDVEPHEADDRPGAEQPEDACRRSG